jgi:hypothetical protein
MSEPGGRVHPNGIRDLDLHDLGYAIFGHIQHQEKLNRLSLTQGEQWSLDCNSIQLFEIPEGPGDTFGVRYLGDSIGLIDGPKGMEITEDVAKSLNARIGLGLLDCLDAFRLRFKGMWVAPSATDFIATSRKGGDTRHS